MSVDPHAAGLYPVQDPDWRAKLRRAGWLLFVPVAGWPMVLGYRKAQVDHFFQPLDHAMPAWHGRHREHFLHGLRAIGVIQGYLAPLWVTLAWLVTSRGYTVGPWSIAALAVCFLAPIFTNVVFPWALLAFALPLRGGPYVTPAEAVTLSVLFHLAVFLLPAGFLRVSATGRFLAAFDFRRTVPFIVRRFRGYLRAWWGALWMNCPAIPATLVAPWSVFWGYVASVAVFNQLLLDEEPSDGVDRPRAEGWLVRAKQLPIRPPSTRFGMHTCTFGPDEEVRVLWTPFGSVPIP